MSYFISEIQNSPHLGMYLACTRGDIQKILGKKNRPNEVD
ncbi:hypothetical protein HORM4_620052 [Vibrio harveyi]|nr:hypothetical protein HORM4_620052 [Vibrio harveyi]